MLTVSFLMVAGWLLWLQASNPHQKHPKRKEVVGMGENKRALFMVWVGPQKSCQSWTKGIKNPLDSDQVCFNFHLLQNQLNNSATVV